MLEPTREASVARRAGGERQALRSLQRQAALRIRRSSFGEAVEVEQQPVHGVAVDDLACRRGRHFHGAAGAALKALARGRQQLRCPPAALLEEPGRPRRERDDPGDEGALRSFALRVRRHAGDRAARLCRSDRRRDRREPAAPEGGSRSQRGEEQRSRETGAEPTQRGHLRIYATRAQRFSGGALTRREAALPKADAPARRRGRERSGSERCKRPFAALAAARAGGREPPGAGSSPPQYV